MSAVVTVLGLDTLVRLAVRVGFAVALVAALAMVFTLSSLAGFFAPPVAGTAVGGTSSVGPNPQVPAPIAPDAAALARPDLAALPALNQYAPANYSSTAAWAHWKDAACSAASLTWLLRAYGMPIATIDQTIGLIGDGTGISPALGLLDASGRPLARAIASLGLVPRNANLGRNPATLEAWLDQGPLALDGAAWYGVGHWFVAYGYDAGGVFTRDSSGHDVRYLTWAQLYDSPVGWSGNAVGIVAGQ